MSFLGGAPRDVTQTEAFRRWFRQSVVRNPNGSPKVMYHGSPIAFDVFDIRLANKKDPDIAVVGFHFSSHSFVAREQAQNPFGRQSRHDVVVRPFFLSIQNPATRQDVVNAVREFGFSSSQEVTDHLKSQGYDGVVMAQSIPSLTSNQIRELNSGKRTHVAPSRYLQRSGNEIEVFTGRDSLFSQLSYASVEEFLSEHQEDHYIVFQPTQIKSATGNRGTFDPNDPNILHGYRRR